MNINKSKVFFSSNMGESKKDDIGNLLGFQQSKYLGTYLGMQLFHARVKKSTFHFLLEKI